MGKDTNIGWCDSTNNPMMGCDGCELWTKTVQTCYAGVLTNRYAGQKGWPISFDVPTLFPYRLAEAARWKDLTGLDRPEKPWLNGYPRTIFLDDLGDTFTESLPVDWLLPHIPLMEKSSHAWLFLTKRPKRMAEFFKILGYVPANFWLGTSITGPETMKRLDHLTEIEGASVYYASVEPFLAGMDFAPWLGLRFHPEDKHYEAVSQRKLDWLILGGESGSNRKTELTWLWATLHQARRAGAKTFIKQLGSVWAGPNDSKGEDWTRWPKALQVREMPEINHVKSNSLKLSV